MNEPIRRNQPDAGIPIASRFGAPLSRLLPIPEVRDSKQGRAPVPPAPSGPSTTASTPESPTAEDEFAGTFYAEIGGHETFAKIVSVFYQGIAADPVLRAMYAEEDLAPAERRMLMFLEQYWGGPRTYLEERGHPRLRMRHMPFTVNPDARDRWLAAMRVGVASAGLSPLHEATLWDYLERAAHSLVNAS